MTVSPVEFLEKLVAMDTQSILHCHRQLECAGPTTNQPGDVRVDKPAADISANRQKFSGVWLGWMCINRQCDIKLAIEKISTQSATVVYASASRLGNGQLVQRTQAKFVGNELVASLQTGSSFVARLRNDTEMEVMPRRGRGRSDGVYDEGYDDTRTQYLWLYGHKDRFYSVAHSRASFDRFKDKGGIGKFKSYAAPFGSGHWLHRFPRLWTDTADAYLRKTE